MPQKLSSSQPIGACAILTHSQNQILLGKRKNSYKAGMLGLPGGRIGLNEKMLTAIAREVTEETGLQNLKFTFVGVVRENQDNYDFIHFVFSAPVGEQEPVLCEPDKCEGWEWFEVNQDLSEVLPGHQAAIQLYISKQKLADLVRS